MERESSKFRLRRVGLHRLKKMLFCVTLRKILICLILLGIVLRVLVFFNFNAGVDATYYITLGRSFSQRGDFYLPFGDLESQSLEPAYSTSTRQAFPIYLSSFYVIFGSSYIVSKIAITVLSIIALVVIYLTTKDLFGKENALVVTGIVSSINILITTTGIIYFESLMFLLFAIGLWGLLKGGKYLPIGMISMSILYVSRLYSLPIYILVICSFFIWTYFIKRENIFEKYYIIGLITTIPFILLLYWSNMNSNFASSKYSIIDAIIKDPFYIVAHYFIVLIFFIIYTLGYAIYFLKPLKNIISIKNLLGAIVIILIVGAPLAQTYQYYVYHFILEIEPINEDAIRSTIFYITLPLLWLVIPSIKYNLDERLRLKEIWENLKNYKEHRNNYKSFVIIGIAIIVCIVLMPKLWLIFPLVFGFLSLFFHKIKWKIAILCLMVVIISISDCTAVKYEYKKRLGEDMNGLINDGDIIMLDEIDFMRPHNLNKFNKDILAPYVTKKYRVVNSDSNETADFIITKNDDVSFENYTIIKKYYNNDKRGIFTQIKNEIHILINNPNPFERRPVYILWGLVV